MSVLSVRLPYIVWACGCCLVVFGVATLDFASLVQCFGLGLATRLLRVAHRFIIVYWLFWLCYAVLRILFFLVLCYSIEWRFLLPICFGVVWFGLICWSRLLSHLQVLDHSSWNPLSLCCYLLVSLFYTVICDRCLGLHFDLVRLLAVDYGGELCFVRPLLVFMSLCVWRDVVVVYVWVQCRLTGLRQVRMIINEFLGVMWRL